MSFTYRNKGNDVVLSEESTADYSARPFIQNEVRALAEENFQETGRHCDVFACDGVTILYRGRGEPASPLAAAVAQASGEIHRKPYGAPVLKQLGEVPLVQRGELLIEAWRGVDIVDPASQALVDDTIAFIDEVLRKERGR